MLHAFIVTFTFLTDTYHLYKAGVFNTYHSQAGAWDRVVGKGLETRKGWIVWSEFVILVPNFQPGKENDKILGASLLKSSDLNYVSIMPSSCLSPYGQLQDPLLAGSDPCVKQFQIRLGRGSRARGRFVVAIRLIAADLIWKSHLT